MSSTTIEDGGVSRRWALGRLLAFVAATALLVAAGPVVLSLWAASNEPYDPNSTATKLFEDRTGIRLIRVAATGGGGLVDVRYQVLDPTKALEALESAGHPILIDEATGTKVEDTWMGHGGHPQALNRAVTYFALLEDRGHLIERGSTVTVVMGDARLEHVPVQ